MVSAEFGTKTSGGIRVSQEADFLSHNPGQQILDKTSIGNPRRTSVHSTFDTFFLLVFECNRSRGLSLDKNRDPRGTDPKMGEIWADTLAYEEVPRLGIAVQGFGAFQTQRFFVFTFCYWLRKVLWLFTRLI